MIVKVNARGTSFKGLAAYLLHDKKAATSGRVVWTEAVNLTTRDPDTAWRVMAATAMDADRLKEQAGVKKTGRQSKESVLHVSLSWEPTEKPDRDEMAAFAKRAIAALKADDRQALIICHSDTKHPHVHVIVNRVSPEDGRMLSSSNEKLALSELALAYEKERGQVVCPQREANHERRKEGEFVRGEKEIPRPEFEAMREAQKEAEAHVPKDLLAQHPQIVQKLRADFRQRWVARARQVKTAVKAKWADLYRSQRGRMAETEGLQTRAVDAARQDLTTAPASSPALQFALDSVRQLPGIRNQLGRALETERKTLAQGTKPFWFELALPVKRIYEAGLKQLALFRPMTVRKDSAGLTQTAIPQENAPTEAQQRLTELAQKFKRESEGQEKEKPPNRVRPKPHDWTKDKDWEPEP